MEAPFSPEQQRDLLQQELTQLQLRCQELQQQLLHLEQSNSRAKPTQNFAANSSVENNLAKNTLASELSQKTICIIGGAGALGALFVRKLQPYVKQVLVIDQDNAEQAPPYLAQSDLVIFSVPIHLTEALIASYSKLIPDSVGICDLTSLKQPSLNAMLAHHPGPVLALHPMFGPDTENWQGQLMINCGGREEDYFQIYLDLFATLGMRIEHTSAKTHDRIMNHIQAIRHFNTYLQGTFLAKEGFALEDLIKLSSPIYSLELTMIGRLFAQNGELYSDIIYDNPLIQDTLERYLNHFLTAKEAIGKGDKAEFLTNFSLGQDFFAQRAQEFLVYSQQLLSLSQQNKQRLQKK